jgi:hypothetical protein
MLRGSESIQKFKDINKTLLLSTMTADESYQTENMYDKFYPVTPRISWQYHHVLYN